MVKMLLLLSSSFLFAKEPPKMKKLNSGYEMPVLGLGTWTLTGETCEDAVYAALKTGYRLIDTARYYGNEKEVGSAIARAIKDGICTREEFLSPQNLSHGQAGPMPTLTTLCKNWGFPTSTWFFFISTARIRGMMQFTRL